MAAAFAVYVIRKPGAGLIAEILAAIIETLMGNFFGPIIILSGLVQGLGFEAIIALKKYKKYDRMTMIEGAILCSVFTMIYNLIVSGYNKIAIPVLIIMMIVRLIVFDVFVTMGLAKGLVKAGLLKGYRISGVVEEDAAE